VPLPATRAGEQLGWVLSHMNEGAEPTDPQIKRHFSAQFLDQVPPATLVAGLSHVAEQGPFAVTRILKSGPLDLAVRLDAPAGARLRVSLVLQSTAPYRIDGLLFQPLETPSKPTTWPAVDRELRALAQYAALLAVELPSGDAKLTSSDRNDTQRNAKDLGNTVHSLDPDRVLAIGSAFKLYVLGALADAIESGTATWTERLAIHEGWKSLPSGILQDEPAGTKHTLLRYATLMISISDNTAADHLMHRLGRRAVDAAPSRLGMRDPSRTLPLLTTREMFALRLTAPTALRHAYVTADGPAGRAALLPRIDRLPLRMPDAAEWSSPHDIETIEWFASATDLCRAIGDLWATGAAPKLAPLRDVLSENPGVPLDASVWKTAGYKGGSEPGVLCLTWVLVRQDGRAFGLSMILNDTRHLIDELNAVAVAEGAIDLLARVR
jgi:beta-lactamase class A